LISRLVVVGVSAVAAAHVDLSPRAQQASAYDYIAPQVAPPIANGMSMDQIAAMLNQTAPNPPGPYLDAYGQTTTSGATRFSAGLAPVKVVQTGDSDHPYLGVFHNLVTSKFATYLAYSADLKTWHTLGAIDDTANLDFGSQPDIRVLPDDSVLFAEEYYGTSVKQPQMRIRYYGNTVTQTGLKTVILDPAVKPTYEKMLPSMPFSKADGTPEFGRIEYNNSILSAKIEISHHYYYFGQRDIQAAGMLADFQKWSDSTDAATDDLVSDAGGNGKIGDREVFKVGSTVYEVVEAQVHPASGNDFGSWRLFLINKTAGTIRQLNPMLVGGAQSLGNPTVSFVTLPSGVPALVFTCFVFSENSQATPPGGHMFVYPLQ
jgi:hypothetical protein